MNSLPMKNTKKVHAFFRQNTAVSLIATVVLTAISTSTFANRPAMDEQSEIAPAATQTEPAQTEQVQTEQNTTQNRPEAEAPSAVEVMMQQQGQQPQRTGDVMQMPAKEMQAGETLSIKLLDYPRRGMSMDKVQQEYGQPMATSGGVGQPPITSWTYNDRVVYFEYSTVLHVVAR